MQTPIASVPSRHPTSRPELTAPIMRNRFGREWQRRAPLTINPTRADGSSRGSAHQRPATMFPGSTTTHQTQDLEHQRGVAIPVSAAAGADAELRQTRSPG